jgi:type IV pilus assembly protein PilO
MNMEDLKKFDLKALDINSIGSWPLPLRLIALLLLYVGLCVGGYFGVINESLNVLAAKELDEQTLREDFVTKQRRAANLDAYKQQLAEMQDLFGNLLRQLPGKTEVESVLTDITQAGLSAGLVSELFRPRNESPKEFYAELPIDMRVSGEFHQLGLFASKVAQLPRIVTLHDIKITAAKADNTKSSTASPRLMLDLSAKTYRYLDQEEIDSAKASTKKGKKGKKGKK